MGGYIGFRAWGLEFLTLGVPFEGLHHKDLSIWGSKLGSPDFGKLPCSVLPRVPYFWQIFL